MSGCSFARKVDVKMNELAACGLKWVSLFGLALLFASSGAVALSTVPPSGLVLSTNAVPRTSALGTPRSIFVHGASGSVTFDESAIATTGTLVIRMTPEIIGLLASPQILTYTSRTVGNLRVTLKLLDGTTADTQMETVPFGRSPVNLDGMWFDPATNGSGVSFHHAASSDVVRAPCPGPISSSASSGRGATQAMMRSMIAGSCRKCWP